MRPRTPVRAVPQLLVPALSAALLLLAFPPFGLRLLVFVALAPWLAAFPYGSGRAAWRSGLVFGAVFELGQLYWLASLTYRWTGSPFLAAVPWLLGSAFVTLFFGLLGWLLERSAGRFWLVLAPAAWVAIEAARSYVPVAAFPWGLLSTPLAPYPAIIQGAALVGAFGVGGWLALGNAVLARAATARKLPIWGAVFFAAGFAVSGALYARPLRGRPMTVVLGQPGVDQAFARSPEAKREFEAALQRILDAAAAERADLAILPEGVARTRALPPLDLSFSIPKGLSVLFGAQRGVGSIHQSALSYDGTWHFADKTRLVIFGEYVPGRTFLPFLQAFDLPTADMTPGPRPVAIPAGGTLVGPMICFEALFPDISARQRANGAKLLAVISDDDWFAGTPAWRQLRDACVFRAIETGLPLVRSASTGYTFAVDSKGRVLAEAPPGDYAALTVVVQTPQG